MLCVNFKAYANYVTDTLHQWDINQDLVINGLSLSVAPEIHFANVNMDRAIVRQSTVSSGVITVRIPNSLLQEAFTIKAYVGVYEGDTFKVIETIEIPVIAKARPMDYAIEDSDEEIYSFKALEYMVARAIETMESAKELIDEKLENANDFLADLFEEHLKETGKTYTLLWENPTPTEEFVQQDIELGESVMSEYEEFLITYKVTKEAPYDQYYIFLKNRHEYPGEFITGTPGGYMTSQMLEFSMVDGIVTPIRRNVVTVNGKAIRIYHGTYFLSNGEINAHNGHLIPGKIYGVKQTAIGGSVGGYNRAPRISEVTLPASDWVGEGNLHSQVVNIDGVTENSQVDLTPSVEQLVIFYEKDISFVTENEDGVVTVYVIGQKPQNDYTIQATITEVQ